MELSLALVNQQTQIETQKAIQEVQTLGDEVLDSKPESEQYRLLMVAAHSMAGISGAAAVALRITLWQIHKRGLWALPNPETGERYTDFESWVTGEIAPFVNEQNNFSTSYLGDAVRAITRMAFYLHLNPVFYPGTDKRITPEEFLVKSPARTVKSVSQLMLLDPEQHKSRPDLNQSAKKDELIGDIMTMSSAKVIAKWMKPGDPIKLKYIVKPLVSGDVDVEFHKLSLDELLFLQGLLGDSGEEINE